MEGQLIGFAGVATGMIVAPGADLAVVIRNALIGKRQGLMTGVGVVGGLLLHTSLAAVGLAAVLVSSPSLYLTLAVGGGVFVTILGIKTLVAAARLPRSELSIGEVNSRPPATDTEAVGAIKALRQGFLTNALNPKAPVLFLSIMPVFLPSGMDPFYGTVTLSAIVIAVGAIWFPLLAVATDSLGSTLRKPAVRRGLDVALGIILVGLGVILLTSQLI